MEKSVYRIGVKGTPVEVTEDVYLMYYRSKRRDKYFEHDVKTETAIYDGSGSIVGYAPSKEDSLERLMETGTDFIDGTADVEAAVIDTVMSEKLSGALALLTDAERDLIEALFFSNGGAGMPERDYAALSGFPQKTINDRKAKILGKLKKLLRD